MAQTTATKTEAEVSTAELQEQIATLRADISDLAAAFTRYGRAQGDALKAQAREGVKRAAQRGANGIADLEDFAAQRYANTEDYVRSHPASAVGIAAGVGFLVGLVTARR